MSLDINLKEALPGAACAFRGYNLTNLGKTPELLAHAAYGPTVERHLREASRITADVLHQPIDLVARVREKRESTVDTFGEDIGLIMSIELAQLELLEKFFDVHYAKAQMALGYSLGELTALVAGGVHKLEDVLPPMVAMSAECTELAHDTTMGILFSRGPMLDLHALHKLVLELNLEQRGILAVSSYLSPNTVLLLGQGDTIDRFKERMKEVFPEPVHLRKHDGQWPPLHTPLLWQKCIPNRAALAMFGINGGFQAPVPPVLSLVTGKLSYNDYNSRDTIMKWLDHPQKLWDAVYEVLATGVQTVLHVGPDPNLVLATFTRLADNVSAQIEGGGMGMRAMRGMASRPWLKRVLPGRVALLRAPELKQVVLEDWLLGQMVT